MRARVLCLTLTALACAKSKPAAAPPEPKASLAERIARFVPVELSADLTGLPDSERQALSAIIEAAKLMDPIFDRQVSARNPELAAQLKKDTSPEGQERLAYFRIMRGPWDRQAHHEPFVPVGPRPKGGGFYPEDLTVEELKARAAAHPEEKAALESLVTVISRGEEGLVATPYSRVYAEWLEPAAAKLLEAARLTTNPSLKRFLELRAQAFKTDDYYESDKAWMDLESAVEVTIGPYETYEDELLGLKASFEAFVTVTDPAASKALARYKELLPEMEQHLPVDKEMKTERGRESPIRVGDVVFTSGDARKSVQTIAFNLPNDERVRKEKGAKKVLLRNIIERKFDVILRPIAKEILHPDQLGLLSAEAFFHQVLFHELSHSLGPAFTTQDGKQVEVRQALGASFSAVEEAKADVMGAYNILFMIEKGVLPKELKEKVLGSYFAGLWRSVRFGVAEAHGKGAALQLNRFLEEKAAVLEDRRLKVDLTVLEKAIERLVHDLVVLQHKGDKAGVDQLLARYGVVSPTMEQALARLGTIPVDVRPLYPLAEPKRE